MKFSTLAAAASTLAGVIASPTIERRAQFNGGDITFYDGGLTACGNNLDTNNQFGVAVSFNVFDSFPGATANPNTNPICQQKIRAFLPSTGQTITVPVMDKCQACADADLDLSRMAFLAMGVTFGDGRVGGLQWDFVGTDAPEGSNGNDNGNDNDNNDNEQPEPEPTSEETPSPEPTEESPTEESEPVDEEDDTPTPVGNVVDVPEETSATTVPSAEAPAPTESDDEEEEEEDCEEFEEVDDDVEEVETPEVVEEPQPAEESTESSEPSEEVSQPSEEASEPTNEAPVVEDSTPSSENSTSSSGNCIDTWNSCNAAFDGSADAVRSYKCHVEYTSCVAAQLKQQQSAKRMHRRRLTSQTSF